MPKEPMELALIEAPLKPAQATKILLVEDNPGDIRLVRESLAGQNLAAFQLVAADRLGESLIRLSGERFDAVLLDLSLPDARGLDTLRRMRRRAPSIPIVIMTGLADEALAMKAVNEGAEDYLVKGDVDGQALARRILFAIERRRSPAARPPSETQPRMCKALGFLGSKGGVGASTIACYLGAALQERTNEPVLLADLDFESGVLSFLMEVEPKYSLAEALENAGRLDSDLWKSLVHSKSPGLDLIATRFAAVPDENFVEQFQRLLAFIRGAYRWVVTDLGRGFHKNLASILEDLDLVCIVTTLELAALRQSRLTIQNLKRLGCHSESLRLVVNEAPKRSPFTSTNLEEMLGLPIWVSIPHIRELREHHRQSTLLPRTPALAKGVTRMAELIAGIPAEKPKTRWPYFLARWQRSAPSMGQPKRRGIIES